MARSRSKRPAWVAPIAVLAVLVAVGAVIVVFVATRPQVDPESFCPIDGDYPQTAILIDATDALSDSQGKAVREEINDLRRNLADHEWVGVFVLNDDNLVLPEPEVAKCNPGSDPNPIYENPEQVMRRFERGFQQPLDDAIAQLVETTRPGATSPILEMIRAVALDPNYVMTRERRLIIVSDMLQNVPQYSHYRDGADFDAWRDTDYARESLQVSLLGVDVEILYLKRVDAKVRRLQTRSHIRFWEAYFDAVGATVRTLKPIS